MLEEHSRDVYTNYLESHTVRYNTLRHEAFKFVDEGAKSSETYEAAMDALEEAADTVVHATKYGGKNASVNGRIRGNSTVDAARAKRASGVLEENSGQHMSEVSNPSTMFTLGQFLYFFVFLDLRAALLLLMDMLVWFVAILSRILVIDFFYLMQDNLDKRIRELKKELGAAKRKCEVYRANLLSVLKDIEDHKLQLSIKVQNVKISLKDGL